MTGEPLLGAQVAIRGLLLGNVSDESGAYFINNVPLGKQTLTVEYLGYEPVSREHEVREGDANSLDFALSPAPIALEGVVVEEEAVRDLSAYVERTPLPSFASVPMRVVEAAPSDTTLMEEWHKSWKDFAGLHSIEYPLLGERVYFRRSPSRRSSVE